MMDAAKDQHVTRRRILSAAEELFAERGIAAVSTRALSARANVNSAAVNYHFGGKDKLTLEVFRDVARRTAEHRISLLDAIEVRAKEHDRKPRLDDVIDAFVDPYVSVEDPQTGALLSHLVLKHRVDPTAWTRQIVREELDELATRYIAALAEAAPHLSTAEVHWRYHLMVGAILIALSDEGEESRMSRLSGGLCSPSDRLTLRRELVRFLEAGFSGGAATQLPKAREE